MGKKLTLNQLQGEKGTNFVERVTLEMGHVWRGTSKFDVGIDGEIEFREADGSMSGYVIKVQCKTVASLLFKQDASTVKYVCEENDIEYWMKVNAPVILVYSLADGRDGWWKDIKQWFSDPTNRKSRQVQFDIEKDRFGQESSLLLRDVSAPRSAGLYEPPINRPEQLITNLLPVSVVNDALWVAPARVKSGSELGQVISSAGIRGRCFYFHENMIWSFYDLSDKSFGVIAESGAAELHIASEVDTTTNSSDRNAFARLLDLGLSDTLYGRGVRFSPAERMYYRTMSEEVQDDVFSYQGRSVQTKRVLVTGYGKKKDSTEHSYFKHNAFKADWIVIGGRWHLLLEPDHFYTTDGRTLHQWSASLRARLKRMERPSSVSGTLHFWSEFIRNPNLMSMSEALLAFEAPITLSCPMTFDESAWLQRESEDAEESTSPESDTEQSEFEF